MADILPEQVPPEQPTPESNGSETMELKLKLSCSPPLGQATIIPADKDAVELVVAAESSTSLGDSTEIVLWHNHNGEHEWTELPLVAQETNSTTACFFHESKYEAASRRLYTATLSGLPKHGHKVSFTLKYRLSPEDNWRWIKDVNGVSDGELYYQGSASFLKHCTSYELSHFIHGISSDIQVESIEPETSKTQLWSLICPVKPAEGNDSAYQHHRLGTVKKAEKWFALVRLWSPWLAPRHGSGSRFEADKDAVLVSFLRSDGMHVVCLAISGVEDVLTTFIHDVDGNVEIKGRNDREENGSSRVLVAVAESFEVANCAVMYHARKVVAQHPGALDKEFDKLELPDQSDAKPQWLEEWYDGLTYCTWNALGQNLTAEKILHALDDLDKEGINITNLIIDDNWQSLSTGASQFQRGWSEFEANPSGFPHGLKGLTTEIRRKHPNIKHISVWHAILGYWGAVDPNGKIAEDYKTAQVEMEPGVAGGTFTVVAAEDAQKMYDDFYRFLSENGIDGVKTDAQFFLDMLLHAPDRRKMIAEYQDAWTIAHLRHFSSRAISCMSQFPQSLFHNQLPRNKPRLLVRNSDDFFPDVDASHAWHVFCNAYNALFAQHLNAIPDWDMFQTSHAFGAFHAAARCVSGGPIYVTDKPGEHDMKLIEQMTAKTVLGKTVILRPQMVGKTVGSVYNAFDADAILKIGTFVGRKGTGTGIMGCFNVTKKNVREAVPLDTFPGMEDGVEYVVGSFSENQIIGPLSKDSVIHLGIGGPGWDVLSAYALQEFKVHGKSMSVACIGLLHKFTGSAAVTNSDIYVESNGRLRIWVSLKALGVLGLWFSCLDSMSVEENFMVMIFGTPVPAPCVRKQSTESNANGVKDGGGVLEIDVETAWEEMGLEAGWSNEVAVEVFVG